MSKKTRNHSEEEKAYSLVGIFDVHVLLIYGAKREKYQIFVFAVH
jgi:hypothetical protein